ncbi:hypothetical protein EJ02DRAFT_514971 [Clathrospora elynae]|uniref:Rhodopsin domain-containing protein n=1 Tax=Clathrospora elynae TaxID=706981 RepID=A0A6A5SDU0_9PLEO|nr:hypothetical protein EJ02DRAFT_514971 [Clathrospora elynae]
MATTLFPDPRNHPDNANLPNINHQATIIGTTIAFLFAAIIAIGLRVWVRVRDRLWGWDDAFVVIAGVASIAGDSVVCQMPEDGLGLHFWTLGDQRVMSYFRHVYFTNIAYSASATFIKLAILFQYLRLFAEAALSTSTAQYRLARRLTWFLIVLSTLWGLAFVLLALFPCNPIPKYWHPYLPGKCIGWGTKEPEELFAMFLGHALSNSLLDILILALPVPFLSMLRIAGKSRVGLITLFTLGFVVAAVAMGRMIALSVNRAGTVPIVDMSYHTPPVFVFGVLEVNIAIIAASIPIFWPIIATLAANKIYVVNEIEVHVEHLGRNVSFDSAGGISLMDRKDASSGRTSKLGVVTTVFDPKPRKINEKTAQSSHRYKQSNTSSLGRTMGLGFAHRPSQESQDYLTRIPSIENTSSGSLTRSEGEDWFMDLNKTNSGGKMTTTMGRTAVPFENIPGSSNR